MGICCSKEDNTLLTVGNDSKPRDSDLLTATITIPSQPKPLPLLDAINFAIIEEDTDDSVDNDQIEHLLEEDDETLDATFQKTKDDSEQEESLSN